MTPAIPTTAAAAGAPTPRPDRIPTEERTR